MDSSPSPRKIVSPVTPLLAHRPGLHSDALNEPVCPLVSLTHEVTPHTSSFISSLLAWYFWNFSVDDSSSASVCQWQLHLILTLMLGSCSWISFCFLSGPSASILSSAWCLTDALYRGPSGRHCAPSLVSTLHIQAPPPYTSTDPLG